MKGSYLKLGVTMVLSLGLMYVLTYAQIRQWDHFLWNTSNFYMALVMVAPMGVLMLGVMWSMFPSRKANLALVAGFLALFAVAFAFGRTQAFVGDERFLEGMIPHHSRAILVCQEADITDPEIIELCDGIIETQREEIAQMQRILERY